EGPDAGAARGETRRLVRAAIDELPVRYREVLALRELEGLSYDEVAQVLGISIGTVESRLHRARARLKRKLAKAREAS
ncbi:MAG: sigma-70 family RNA polymerase sigma factor, partial [Planctomycetes bacterium]|nr:sigma-70 family RNA polymerase sigma factor [Planctomycetota bacterium]